MLEMISISWSSPTIEHLDYDSCALPGPMSASLASHEHLRGLTIFIGDDMPWIAKGQNLVPQFSDQSWQMDVHLTESRLGSHNSHRIP